MDGEHELIARLRALTERAAEGRPARVAIASGDDAAVTVAAGATVTSVDAAVEGVHFRLDTTTPRAAGRKALAAALSDLAAMGAEVGEAYVILGIPDSLADEAIMELAAGLAEVAGEHGATVLGGDVTQAPALWLGLTVVGHARSPAELVARSGGRPGDVVAVTGELGGAAAGLELLERPELGATLDPATADSLRERQRNPAPRLRAGRVLAAAGAHAMIDVSDGLGSDCGHLASASGVRIEVDLARVPVAPGVADVASGVGVDVEELVASGGEDYELLACLAPDRLAGATASLREVGLPLTAIGSVREGDGVALLDARGAARAVRGFDHLRPPARRRRARRPRLGPRTGQHDQAGE
jgi:thiamine-monophosphate kinase